MTDYGTELRSAQIAQRQVADLEAALADRGLAVARAWAARPGGLTWADFVDAFNSALPAKARLGQSALRRDEALYRQQVVA